MSKASLWGLEFAIPEKPQKKETTKKIIEKINNPKEVKSIKVSSKKSNSDSLNIEERLLEIKEKVLKVLGHIKNDIVVIKNYDDYIDYINKAIESKCIAVDTETNNSLDPVSCKLMGLCLYYPGGKRAYIPVNHRDHITKERFDWQLTEEQIADGLRLLNQQFPDINKWNVDGSYKSYGEWFYYNIFLKNLKNDLLRIETHNGKFDYEVLKCTCGVDLVLTWDSLIAAKLLDENEFSYSLKEQFVKKIDPSQEKYSIEGLFEGIEYADVDPDIFAFYAAQDSYMTDKLTEFQLEIFKMAGNDKLLKLFGTTELPQVTVLAEMELAGMKVDNAYSKRLSNKYHLKLDELDNELKDFLNKIDPILSEWKKTSEATEPRWIKQSAKQRANALKSKNYDDSKWKFIQDSSGGSYYKLGKSRLEQLDSVLCPDSLASATQLGIILYSVLKAPVVNNEKPTATGEEELKNILKETKDENIEFLCSKMLIRRGLVKLLTTYIDTIPEIAERWPDGRVRTHFNQYGAATGRLSSSDPINFQNIPSNEKSIRLMFCADCEYKNINVLDGEFIVDCYNQINLDNNDNWKYPEEIELNSRIFINDNYYNISDIKKLTGDKYRISLSDSNISGVVKTRIKYKIIGGDFSAQEPRITAFFSNDENMIQAYLQGKDLYSVIAAQSFDKPYEDCLEFYPEGTKIEIDGKEVICGNKTHQNKEGKGRRTQAKSILLGLLYGRGSASIGEQLGKTREEAEDIINKFFKAFPKVKTWITESQENCKKTGYVEDVAGRRRRLPDINLPSYTVKYKDKNRNVEFNPFLGCVGTGNESKLLLDYEKQLQNVKSKKQVDSIKAKANNDGIEIINNGGFISQAERQCVNARIQGSAATLTKCALNSIYYDQRLKEVKAKLINSVHDEILIEAPSYYSDKASDLLIENMINSAKPWIPNVPMKVDTYIVDSWYADEYEVLIENEYKHLIKDGKTDEDAKNYLIANHIELLPNQVLDAISGNFA